MAAVCICGNWVETEVIPVSRGETCRVFLGQVLCLLCVVCLIETAVFSGIGFCFRFSNLRFSEMGIHWRHVCVGFICI